MLWSWKGQASSGKFKILLTFSSFKTYSMEMKLLVSNTWDSFTEKKRGNASNSLWKSHIEKKNPCNFAVVVRPGQEKNNFWYRATKMDLRFRAGTWLRAEGLSTICQGPSCIVIFKRSLYLLHSVCTPTHFQTVKLPEHCYCKYMELLTFSTLVISISSSKSHVLTHEIEE